MFTWKCLLDEKEKNRHTVKNMTWWFNIGRKIKVVLFPEIGRVKIFIISKKNFNFKKHQTSKQTNKQTNKGNKNKKTKETKEGKRISQENRLKKINLRPPGLRFFSSSTFPETSLIFLFVCFLVLLDHLSSVNRWTSIKF